MLEKLKQMKAINEEILRGETFTYDLYEDLNDINSHLTYLIQRLEREQEFPTNCIF